MSLYDQIDTAVDNERAAYDRKVNLYHIVMLQRLPDGSGVPSAADLDEEQAAINAWVETKARLSQLMTQTPSPHQSRESAGADGRRFYIHAVY